MRLPHCASRSEEMQIRQEAWVTKQLLTPAFRFQELCE